MPKKQSSSRLSTIASKVLRAHSFHGMLNNGVDDYVGKIVCLKVSDVRALAASVLSQDEVKGQKKRVTTIWIRPGKDYGWKVFEGKVEFGFSPRKKEAITIAKQAAAFLKPSRVVLHVGKDKKVLKEFR